VKDALRRGRVDVEAREALLGHSGSTSKVSRGYGAGEMLERWGVKVLRNAVAKIKYTGLDLSKLKTGYEAQRTSGPQALIRPRSGNSVVHACAECNLPISEVPSRVAAAGKGTTSLCAIIRVKYPCGSFQLSNVDYNNGGRKSASGSHQRGFYSIKSRRQNYST
jgi:hypothetical protein